MVDLADRRDGPQGPSDDLANILADNKKLLGHMQKIISNAIEREASDIHLVPGYPVTYRVHGNLTPVGTSPVPRGAINPIAQALTPPRLKARFNAGQDCDYSIAAKVGSHRRRFRVNAFKAREDWCLCMRVVPDKVPTFEWMGLPEELAHQLTDFNNGLVIVSGITGSGKSTTLAALISLLNEQGGLRIITIEEPIEFVHKRVESSVITQREVGRDVDSFFDGLKYGLRQDPDVILVGEIRDKATARMALTAAETGHLILTSLHTQDAKGAVTRILDLFPPDTQKEVRAQLALSLRSVVCQQLLPAAYEGDKRVLALEIMFCNPAVRGSIKDGKIDQIESVIQTSKRDGSVQIDDHLVQLVKQGKITLETAKRYAKSPDTLMNRTGVKNPGVKAASRAH